tara:strand:- start:515 stop:1033 length:519 start_codon:yes stop_codon:yes gene_type:complete
MIKVIGGKYKGRKLLQVPKTNVRPTQAVVRKSMFDILGNLNSFDVLDLYSGVGTLGIESLSRGAKHLTSVERDRFTYKVLSENLNLICSEDDVVTYNMDVKQFLRFNNQSFDLIIADPPYNVDVYSYLSDSLRPILNENGILCIEMKKKTIPDSSVRTRTFGRTQLTFWRNK